MEIQMALQQFKTPEPIIDNLATPFDVYKIYKGEGPSNFFKNHVGSGIGHRLTHMSANDYYKLVASQSNTTPEKLMEHRQKYDNEMSVDDMRKKMREGTKFDTPWIVLMDRGEKGTVRPYWQEGLHRMLAAGQEYGMDTKFPVYLGYENDRWEKLDDMPMDDFIKYYDDTRLDRYNKYKQAEEAKQKEIDNYYKESTARWYHKLVDEVTPEMIRAYMKYEDELFKDEWND